MKTKSDNHYFICIILVPSTSTSQILIHLKHVWFLFIKTMKETLIDSIPMKRVVKVLLLRMFFFQGWLNRLLTFLHCGFCSFFLITFIVFYLPHPIGPQIILLMCPIATVATFDKIPCTWQRLMEYIIEYLYHLFS